MRQPKNLVGQKFHHLLVLEPALPQNNRPSWLCLCDCGNKKIIQGKYLKNGDTKSCGCANKESRQQLAQEMIKKRTKYEPRITVARNVWRQNSTYNDELSFEEFYNLSQQNCFYCGIEPSIMRTLEGVPKRAILSIKNSTFYYNGIDRLDNSKSYVVDNIISACWDCNRAKREQTIEQFLLQIDGLISRLHIRESLEDYRQQANKISNQALDNEYYNDSVECIYESIYNDGDLELKQFYRLTQLDCYYCGSKSSNTKKSGKKSSAIRKQQGTYYYNGLDRISGDFPHNYSNCIPSCKYCNYAKRKLTIDQFDAWIDRLEKNRETLRANLNKLFPPLKCLYSLYPSHKIIKGKM